MYHQLQLSYDIERKLQTNDAFWKKFIDRKIIDYKIIESENNMGKPDEMKASPTYQLNKDKYHDKATGR